MTDYRVLETRPITNSNEWQDYVLRLRLTWPVPINRQEEIDRILRIVAILSDIRNEDHRHRCLQGFVNSLLVKRPGKKRAARDEQYARRDLKILDALEQIRQQGYILEDAKNELRKHRKKYGFGPDDNLPEIDGIDDGDQRARRLWGYKRKPLPRRQKEATRKPVNRPPSEGA
jgi:hypothetical protein